MSSSYSCEMELRKLADELHKEASTLEEAAEVLETLRLSGEQEKRIESAKSWAKEWMGRK